LSARADPDFMMVSIKEAREVTKIVADATNFVVNIDNSSDRQRSLTAGFRATKYINPVTGKLIDVLMLPYLHQGTIGFASLNIPFPASEIDKPPLRIEYNKEMWSREYPPDQSAQTQWQYAAFSNESMAIQYLGGQSAINSITLT
jgi:hypothetical protein